MEFMLFICIITIHCYLWGLDKKLKEIRDNIADLHNLIYQLDEIRQRKDTYGR